MQIPETPSSVTELDLMKRLDEYANGISSWTADLPGASTRQSCRTLHTNLMNFINGVMAFLLDRVTAREMETFTMHDRVHGRKVAHLMWHILKPERREQLTPPEIGMLMVSAHLHDLGMGLSPSERNARLAPDSDLWDKVDIQDTVRDAIDKLRSQIGDPNVSESIKTRAEQQLFQAEEALLTQDTRERHATPQRYSELINLLADFHKKDPFRIPNIEEVLSFDGDSFCDKLIEVCVSHNEDADVLVANDPANLSRPKFPMDFPVGSCNADLHTVAAALRLADILDFDRERTPAVLFHYLLPTGLLGFENRSILEWGKHLAISNWHIEKDTIVFRGRSKSHITHHAVVQFCGVIANEIRATHATFSPLGQERWPFELPLTVKADIHEEGYKYVPYRFEMDDERVYSLLMGGAIYDNPLVAVRELVQNAVDACKLRDSLNRLYEEYEEPGKTNRIFIRYEEPTAACPQPLLIVRDSGIGMDAYTLERYFLQVGRSYYSSSDFNQFRVQLRKKDLDFAPISEFGIGFLSAFLLADHVEVETAMWEPLRGDTLKRKLQIDGPTRLIRLDEHKNDGAGRFKGTRITLFLSPKLEDEKKLEVAKWSAIKKYLKEICLDLPYSLNLEYISSEGEERETIEPMSLVGQLPEQLIDAAFIIPVDDKEFGMQGEIVMLNASSPGLKKKLKKGAAPYLDAVLLRGGFKIDDIDAYLPDSRLDSFSAGAKLSLTWVNRRNKRFISPNLARNSIADESELENHMLRIWLSHFLRHVDELPARLVDGLYLYLDHDQIRWIEEFNGRDIYKLARLDWSFQLRQKRFTEDALESWESGTGEPLWYDVSTMARDLLDLILPRVTRLLIKQSGEYVKPPRPGWLSELENWHHHISEPKDWGPFADYEPAINDFLLYFDPKASSPDRLNASYQDRFTSLPETEVDMVITDLGWMFSSPKQLRERPSETLRHFCELGGDLKVGNPKRSFKLKDILKGN